MTSPRGVALVINNSVFDQNLCNLDPRDGSEVDVTNIERMLRHFDFEVIVKKELSSQVSCTLCIVARTGTSASSQWILWMNIALEIASKLNR